MVSSPLAPPPVTPSPIAPSPPTAPFTTPSAALAAKSAPVYQLTLSLVSSVEWLIIVQ